MASRLYNLAKMTTATVGTGTITLGAADTGFLSFAAAGVQNGETVTYAIEDGNNREIGRGVYSSAGTTLTRATILASTNSGAAINLSGSAKVGIAAAAQDLPIGKQPIWVPAGAMSPRSSNGCAPLATVETTTNKVNLRTLDFDAAAIEYAQFAVRMPKQWDEGTLSAIFVWKHAATTTNFGVVWTLQALSLSDDDASDTAFGTGVDVTDTGGTTNDIYQSPETAAITPGNTPSENDLNYFQVSRKATDGSDTMAIDAGLIGVFLIWQSAAGNEN